jgi:hypothetical protein
MDVCRSRAISCSMFYIVLRAEVERGPLTTPQYLTAVYGFRGCDIRFFRCRASSENWFELQDWLAIRAVYCSTMRNLRRALHSNYRSVDFTLQF